MISYFYGYFGRINMKKQKVMYSHVRTSRQIIIYLRILVISPPPLFFLNQIIKYLKFYWLFRKTKFIILSENKKISITKYADLLKIGLADICTKPYFVGLNQVSPKLLDLLFIVPMIGHSRCGLSFT